MLTVNQTGMQTRITHTHIRQLTQQRLTDLIAEYGEYNPQELGWFVYVETTDTDNDCRAHHPNLLTDYDGIEFGQAGYYSPYEFCIDHGDCYELVRVLSDGGEAIAVFVPKEATNCPLMLQLCQSIAVNQKEES